MDFHNHSKKLKKSGIFRILDYLYLQMSKICRNFVVSKDKADGMLIKEKKLLALNLEIARINGSKIYH